MNGPKESNWTVRRDENGQSKRLEVSNLRKKEGPEIQKWTVLKEETWRYTSTIVTKLLTNLNFYLKTVYFPQFQRSIQIQAESDFFVKTFRIVPQWYQVIDFPSPPNQLESVSGCKLF